MPMKRMLFLLLLLAQTALAQPPQKTVKEFLKLSKTDTTSYLVHGVVSKVRSTTSGSFYLQDATGTLLVYGIQDPSRPGSSFKQLDIVQGDTLTVLGRFTIYGGSTKEMKDGRLIAKADGPDHNLSFMERLDHQPSFKGKEGPEALKAFEEWIQRHIKAPADGATGTVRVRFVVGRTGHVQEVQIDRGAAPSLNEEALRVVRSSPKWKPAQNDGTKLRTSLTVPVVFN